MLRERSSRTSGAAHQSAQSRLQPGDIGREQHAAMQLLAALKAAGLDSTKDPASSEDILVPAQAAAGILGIKQQTLALWRCERTVALPYVKIGRRVHYRLGDLRRFVSSKEQRVQVQRMV